MGVGVWKLAKVVLTSRLPRWGGLSGGRTLWVHYGLYRDKPSAWLDSSWCDAADYLTFEIMIPS
jgi:hypothetical protein